MPVNGSATPPKPKQGRKTKKQVKDTQKQRTRKTKKRLEDLQRKRDNISKEISAGKKRLEASKKMQEEKGIVDEQYLSPTDKQAIEKGDAEVIFKPNPGPQTDFLAASEDEVFYGGARGGGKSYAMLVDPLRDCDKREHRALILRKTMPELRDIIAKTHHLYPKAFPGAKWREQDKLWIFPSGARIEFGYADNALDALRYQGQAYSWIGVDELPQYPDPEIWHMLRGSLRRTDPRITPYMRATGNPGNVGSLWVKEMFIDAAPPNTTFIEEVKFETPKGPQITKITRRYIPATVWDNPFLTFDEKYVTMLATLPEHMRRQWLEGDWTVFENAAFPEFRLDTHVVEPFEIPDGWTRIRGADWGYASPHCVLWAAVDWDGNMYVYREKYGTGETADVFAGRVMDLDRGERIKYGVLDSSAWSNRGDTSPSPAETMAKHGLKWRPADRSPNSRVNGKLEVHRRFATDPGSERPRLVVFSNCRNLIRTLPMLPLDENNMEDVDTDAEDHAYDALRYLCMSRPVSQKRRDWNEFNLTERKGHAHRYQPASRTFGY